MSMSYAGGEDPTIPTHYTYTHEIPIEIPIPKKFPWSKQYHKRTWKEITEIIESDDYYILTQEERRKCKPASVGGVKKYGNVTLKNNAEHQFAEKLVGIKF